jgi:hypothetical protein
MASPGTQFGEVQAISTLTGVFILLLTAIVVLVRKIAHGRTA